MIPRSLFSSRASYSGDSTPGDSGVTNGALHFRACNGRGIRDSEDATRELAIRNSEPRQQYQPAARSFVPDYSPSITGYQRNRGQMA